MQEYALIYWTWKDIQQVYSGWSEKQCREFLERNEAHIKNIIWVAGWEAIRFCVDKEDRWTN